MTVSDQGVSGPLADRHRRGGRGHHAFWHRRGAVHARKGQVGVGRGGIVAKDRIARHETPLQSTGVRIEQQLVGIEAMASLGRMGTVRPQAVERPGRKGRHMAVPDGPAAFGQGHPRGLPPAVLGEQAQLDSRRVLREHGDVRARPVPMDAERTRPAGQHVRSGSPLHAVASISSEKMPA